MKDLKCLFTNMFESVSTFMNSEIVIGEALGGADKMSADRVQEQTNQGPKITEVTQEGLKDLKNRIVDADGNPVSEVGRKIDADHREPDTQPSTFTAHIEPKTDVYVAKNIDPSGKVGAVPVSVPGGFKAPESKTIDGKDIPTETAPAAPNPGILQPTEAPATDPEKATQQNSDLFAEQEKKKEEVAQGERDEIAANFEINR